MLKRLSHPLVIAALVGLVVLLPVAGLATLPRWTVDPVAVGSPGEDFQPRSWSPDGTRFIFQRVDQFVVVRVSDGTVVRSGFGAFAVWVDDQTIDATYAIGLMRSQLVRINLVTGRRDTIVPQLGPVRLIGRGVVDLAATNVIGDIETTIVDPVDGRKIAYLPGIRAFDWLRPGVLIGETATFDGPPGLPPGSLVVWTLRDGARAIGPGLKQVRDVFAYSPTGDAIACVCTAADAVGGNPPRGIYRVPVDGSAASRLTEVARGSFNGDPVVSWFDDGSLVFLDGVGLHQIGADGTSRTIPVEPDDLPREKYFGRAYRFGNAIALASQFGSAEIGQARLTVMSPTGEVGYRQTFPSWNGLGLILDPARTQALVATDPQRPDGPPQRYFVLRHH